MRRDVLLALLAEVDALYRFCTIPPDEMRAWLAGRGMV